MYSTNTRNLQITLITAVKRSKLFIISLLLALGTVLLAPKACAYDYPEDIPNDIQLAINDIVDYYKLSESPQYFIYYFDSYGANVCVCNSPYFRWSSSGSNVATLFFTDDSFSNRATWYLRYVGQFGASYSINNDGTWIYGNANIYGNIPKDYISGTLLGGYTYNYVDNSSETLLYSYDNNSIYAQINGYFQIVYRDVETTGAVINEFNVRLEPRYSPDDSLVLYFNILDPEGKGYSYNGYFYLTPRGNDIDPDYMFSAFRWIYGNLNDMALPTLNNYDFKTIYQMKLLGSEGSYITKQIVDETKYHNGLFGNFDYPVDYQRQVFLASNFSGEFDNDETCTGFSFSSITIYPYNVRGSFYIFTGETHGKASFTAIENQNTTDIGTIYPPTTFNGAQLNTDFNYSTPDEYDFTPVADLLSALFNPFVVSIATACIIIGLVGYVLYGKN